MKLVCLFLAAATALGQEAQQGSITGYVSDSSSAMVARARVTVTNRATGAARSEETNAAGLYNFVGLNPGDYDVSVSAAGFKTDERPKVQLDTGASLRIDFAMEVGSARETISIAADAPILKTESGEVSTLISGTQVSELALNGRNFTQFLTLGTGVVSQQSGHQMGLGQEGNPLMAVNGGRITMNKFTFDGTLAMDTGGNRGVDVFPPMEAVQEISVSKSNYSADSGGFGSSVVNIVTKSGSQQFHGGVYEYFRNDAMDARNFFSANVQIIRLNNFGFTLGGPVYIPGRYNTGKTKDFFFVSESWYRRVGPQIDSYTTAPVSVFTALVPTAAMKQGDFSALLPKMVIKDPSGNAYPGNIIPQSQIDPNAELLLQKFYPLPNASGAQNYTFNTGAFTRYHEDLIREDHYFSANWIWTTRYAQDSWTQAQTVMRPSSTTLPTFPGLYTKPGKNLASKLTTVINASTLNLFTFGYSENKITATPLGGQKPAGYMVPEAFPSNYYNVVPDITLANGYAGIGVGGPLKNSNPIFTFKDDFSLSRGSHTIKAGVELIYFRKNEITHGNEQGTFNFNGGVTGYSVADFLIGRAFTYTENGTDSGNEVTGSDTEFYVQDDWKASTSLTLNMGIRGYLSHGGNGGAAVAGNIAEFVPSLFDRSKEPQITSAGALVPGTGDLLNGIITPSGLKGLNLPASLKPNKTAWGPRFGLAWAPGSHKTVVRGGYGLNYFWGTDSGTNLRMNPPFTNSVTIQKPLLSNPLGALNSIYPASLSVSDIYNRYPSIQSWSLNIQRELFRNTSLEVGYVGTRGNHLPRTLQLNQGFPNYPTSVNVALRRPYPGFGSIAYLENTAISKYNSLQAQLTHRFQHGLFFQASYTFSKALGDPEGMPLDSTNKELDYGLLALDRTHALTVNFVWQMPFFATQHGLAGLALKGWQIAGIASFQGGLPINVTQAGDAANFGGSTGAQRPNLIGDPNKNLGASLYQWFNTAAYQTVVSGVGNAPFDSTRGPGVSNFDISLLRNFKPIERLQAQIGVETFNTFNHSQFENVGNQIGSATFGVVTSARDPRILQLRAKLTF
jgi:hypothetical protein